MTRARSFWGMAIFLALLLPCLIDCSDNGTGPVPQSKEHIFYVAADSGSVVWVFSVEKKKFVDSILFESIPPDEEFRLYVIGDDEKLAAASDVGTYIADLKNNDSVGKFSDASVCFSPNAEYYLTDGPGLPRWELRRFSNNELIFYDTVYPYLPRFSNDSRCLSYSHTCYVDELPLLRLNVYYIDSDSLVVDPKYYDDQELSVWISHAIPSRNKIFCWAAGLPGVYVCASDIGTDSIRILNQLPFTSGAFPLVSPDDRKLYSAYIPGWEDPPSEQIYIFDAETEQPLGSMSTSGIQQPGVLAVCSDGRYLMSRSAFPRTFHEKALCLFDTENKQLIGSYEFNGFPGSIATKGVQNGSKKRWKSEYAFVK